MDPIQRPFAHPPLEPAPAGGRGVVPYDVDADERAAAGARRRYQAGPMAALGADATIAPHLALGEDVVAVRGRVGFEQRPGGAAEPVSGRAVLYVTTGRIILCAEPMIEMGLEEVEEVHLAAGRLLLVLRDGAGVALETELPRLLRVEIAAARAAARM
jgi:hypothetical protein